MTSKLVVNTIEADTGISSVSFASSISMNSTAKFHFSAAGIDIGADTNINRPAAGVLGFNVNGAEKVRIDSSGHMHGVGVVTATHFYGDGSNLTGITGTTINNNADNRVITGSGTANTLNAESGVTIDGSGIMAIQGSGQRQLNIGSTNAGGAALVLDGDSNGDGGGGDYAIIRHNTDGDLEFYARNTGGATNYRFRSGTSETVRITSTGNLLVGGHSSPLTTYQSSQTRLSIHKSSGSGAYLELGGAQNTNGTSAGTILFVNNNNADAANNDADGKILSMQRVEIVTSDSNAGDDSGGDLVFMTKPEAGSLDERLRIHSNGSVSIANTRNYYGALNVEKTATSNTAIDVKASGSGSYAKAIIVGDHNTIQCD